MTVSFAAAAVAAALLLFATASQTTGNNNNNNNVMRVLALFSGTNNELGIDHRLGRHLLELAAQRARTLYPQLHKLELLVLNDDTDCTRLNTLPSRVTDLFYNTSGGGGNEDDSAAVCVATECVEAQKNKAQIDAIIGPSCDFLVDLIARMAAYWRTPIYSVASVSSRFARKDIYSTLTRLSPSTEHLSAFVLRTLQHFNWRHLAVIVDDSQPANVLLLESLEQAIASQRVMYSAQNKQIEHKVFKFDSFRSGSNNSTGRYEACTEAAREALLGARRVARVFLLMLNDDPQAIRRLMLCVSELRLDNGEFTFLAVAMGLSSSRPTRVAAATVAQDSGELNTPHAAKSSAPRQGAGAGGSSALSTQFDWYSADDEPNNMLAKRMFESLMVFSVEMPISSEYSLFVEQALELAHHSNPDLRFERQAVGALAIALHDALLLAVEAHLRSRQPLKAALAHAAEEQQQADDVQDGDMDDAATFVQHSATRTSLPLMWNESYRAGLMSDTHINANGDQEFDYTLHDLEPELGLMRPVASFVRDTRQLEWLSNSYVHWPLRTGSRVASDRSSDLSSSSSSGANEPPPDEPECGFNDDAERCIDRQNLYAALAILTLVACFVSSIVAVSWHKYKNIKYQMQLDDLWWKIDWSELQFIQVDESIASNAQAVARAIKSGSSIVSGGDDDGAGSFVTLVKRPQQAGRSKLSSVSKPTSDKHDLGVPVIITSAAAPTEKTGDAKKDQQDDANQTIRQYASDNKTSLSGHMKPMSLVAESYGIKSEFSTVVRASNLALYKSELVIVKQLNARSVNVSRELLVELRSMRELLHENLATFVGLCVDTSRLSIVYEYCSRGSLQSMLVNKSISMDWTLKYSILGDIVSGLHFLHTTLLDYHGRLKSTNLVLDSRFTVKITDFGLQNLYSQLDVIKDTQEGDNDDDDDDGAYNEDDGDADGNQGASAAADSMSLAQHSAYNMESVSVRGVNTRRGDGGGGGDGSQARSTDTRRRNRGAARFFWTAPEHLRAKDKLCSGSKRGDVYSLAIIMSELITRQEPYYYGTNARPDWANVKSEHRVYAQHGSSPATMARQRHSVTSTGAPGSVVSAAGQAHKRGGGGASVVSTGGAARAGLRSRLSTGSTVAPSVRPAVGSAVGADPDTMSVKSASSAHSRSSQKTVGSLQSKQQQHVVAAPVCLDVGAIINEDDELANSDTAQPVGPSTASDILDQLRMGVQPEPVRPYLPNFVLAEVTPGLVELMRSCWSESPLERPNMGQIRSRLRKITKGIATKNYLDNLLDRLQDYAANLEKIVDAKSADIVEEKQRTETMLYQLVPRFVADRLKRNEPIVPRLFDGVTVFFSDIVGFEKYASMVRPDELIGLLNSIYSSFDSIISSFDVTKIETIIDQFLVASGISLQQQQQYDEQENQAKQQLQQEAAAAEETKQTARRGLRRLLASRAGGGGSEETNAGPQPSGDDANNSSSNHQKPSGHSGPSAVDLEHYKRTSAEQIARMALCIRDLIKSFSFRYQPCVSAGDTGQATTAAAATPARTLSSFNVRIGIHSGTVCAGIVGVKRPKYCLIGDTVNVASRMHTNSKANRIQISENTRALLEQVPGFSIEPRGRIDVKGKGAMDTFWLESSF